MSYHYQEAQVGELNFADEFLFAQSALILQSYQASFNRPLIDCPADTPAAEQARLLFMAPQAVLSHDREVRDGAFINIYNYANRAACLIFERSFADFIQLPSLQSVAAQHSAQGNRNNLLGRCLLLGPQAFDGERKAASGKSVLIDQAVLFNLVDEYGIYRGQAAVLESYRRE